MRRSMLFLPGNTPNIIINGDALGADCDHTGPGGRRCAGRRRTPRACCVCNAIGRNGLRKAAK